jgi:hypothetical protein
MTGGHADAVPIDAFLAAAAERYGGGIGVGWERAALENPSLAPGYRVVRDAAPSEFVVANLGAVQLRDHGPTWAAGAVVPRVSRAGVEELAIGASGTMDVTGGMSGKVAELLRLADAGVASHVFGRERLADFLAGRPHGGTEVVPEDA